MFASAVLLCAALVSSPEDLEVRGTQSFVDSRLDLSVIHGEVSLPYGNWRLDPVEGLEDVQLKVVNDVALLRRGLRFQNVQIQAEIRKAGWAMSRLSISFGDHAEGHDGIGPSSWDEMIAEAKGNRWQLKQIQEASKHCALVPMVPFRSGVAAGGDASFQPTPVVLDLTPSVDDGKHWVLLSDGTSERREVDAGQLLRLGVVLQPRKDAPVVEEVAMKIQLFARIVGSPSAELDLCFRDRFTERTLRCRWRTDVATDGTRKLLIDWAGLRAEQWQRSDPSEVSTMQMLWRSRLPELYGLPLPQQRRERGVEIPGLFTLMGGQPALQETLQLELIGAIDSEGEDEGERAVPIEMVAELGIASHPFEQMLEGRTPVDVELAHYVPQDRAFVHLSHPGALRDFLGQGAPSVARFASVVTGNGLSYDLEQRYATALGLSPALARQALGAGWIEELAVFLPDLFFVDGTDLTILARLGEGHGLDGLLSLGGLSGEDRSDIREVPTRAGSTAYWARRSALLFLSTSREDIAASLALYDADGKGSLGRSAEYRFMTACVPTGEQTVGQVYLSDAFLRRLTGPEVKIGQLRRARVRLGMEAMVAARQLRRADGHEPGSVKELVEQGYLARGWVDLDLQVSRTGQVRSEQWGPLHQMKPLSACPVTEVTRSERQMYAAYVDDYRRYWRQFYDPIAIRYDQAEEGEHELTMFILPLIDSSIYAELRELIPPQADQPPLRIPQFEPAPVVQFSAQLPEMAWVMVASEMGDFLREFAAVDPHFYDLLGPQVHIAIQDADPMIRIGSGDVLGLVADGSGSARLDDDMVLISLMGAALTRPCDVAIEVQDPRRVQQVLDGLELSEMNDEWVTVRSYRLGDGRRVFSIHILDTIKWDFSAEVSGNYLVLSNHPWSTRSRIVGVESGRLCGASVEVDLDALSMGRGGAFASYAEHERNLLYHSMARLLPWLQSGARDVTEAADLSAELLGRRPDLVDPEDLVWDGRELRSRRYGFQGHELQPGEAPRGEFGLLQGIEDLSIELQIEEDGLRTVVRWSSR